MMAARWVTLLHAADVVMCCTTYCCIEKVQDNSVSCPHLVICFSANITRKDTTNICQRWPLAAALRSRECQDALYFVGWHIPSAAQGAPCLS